MDFYKDVIQPVGGFIVSCCIVVSIIKSCSEGDKSERVVSPKTISEPEVIEPVPSSAPSPSAPEYEEYWYDDPVCGGTGDCNVCDGKGTWDIGGSIYKCGNCYGGRCPNCGGQGQVKGFREVN